MILVDARRLTGPNHIARTPLVVVELTLEGESIDRVVAVYGAELARMRVATGLPPEVAFVVRPHAGGAVIGYEAPLDAMLGCAEMSEWAVLSAIEILGERAALPLEPKQAEVEAIFARDRNPRMLAIASEAKRRDLPFLWDDGAISVGAGSRSAAWPIGALPDADDVAWDRLGAIPIALVTGTNGKTTSARLLARVAREAGLRVGATSSDEIAINGTIIDTGDWTGPAAARVVLRSPDVDIAILETARGGILRRGLAIENASAALITNVSEDHVGGYGIDDLGAMTEVKAVIARAIPAGGTVVLNAHDPKLVVLAASLAAKIVFFANLDREDPIAARILEQHRAKGGGVVFAKDGRVFAGEGPSLFRVDEAPITFGGAASYNIENILAVVAMARALSLPDDAIVAAVTGFGAGDNPRRGELVEKNGVRVMLDFGHNPDGVEKVMDLVASLRRDRSGKLTVIAASAGDRSDHDIDEVSRALAAAKPDRVIVRDLVKYMRGRAPGEVFGLYQRSLAAHGLSSPVTSAGSEVDALRVAFTDAKPDDFIVILVHLDHDEVVAFLAQ